MRSQQAACSFFLILLLWSDLLWVVNSAILDEFETWTKFPFTVAVDQSSSTPEWLEFSRGGKSGTSQQSLTLLSLISQLSATFATSSTDALSDMSSVGGEDVKVTFKLTPQLLTGESFSSAMDKLATYVERWGSKEMDFEVGTGPGNATTEGVFEVRLGYADRDEEAAAAGAAAALSIVTAGGGIASAVAAAGEAASAAVVAAGGDSAAVVAAKAAAEAAAEDLAQKTKADYEKNPATTLSGTNANFATTSVTSAPVITTPATTLPMTGTNTLPSNGTMTSQAVSSTCATCTTCPGFDFGAGWPDLGSTTNIDDDDDDDQSSPEDANDEEGDVPERRALPGRFSLLARKKRHLQKRVTKRKMTDMLGTCKVSKAFAKKPAYYNAANVLTFEQKPPGNSEAINFMNNLKRWAVPIEVPPGDCDTIPTWTYLSTDQCLGKAPLPDGSTFSNVPGAVDAIWAVGGNSIAINREVNIDHVYEAKYLLDFFDDLENKQNVLCDEIKNVWDSPDGSKLTALFGNLPNKKDTEFIGMAKVLNSLKEAVTKKDSWTKVQPLTWKVEGPDIDGNVVSTSVGLMFTTFGKDFEDHVVTFDPANDLAELTRAAQVLDVMNTPEGIAYMSAPNDRIYKAFQDIGCQEGLDWAELYKSYILNRFAKRNVQIQDLFTKVLAMIGPEYRPEYMTRWKQRYPLAKMQLPPPTDWATELPAIQQAFQAQFAINPALLNKRQAVTASPAAGACVLNGANNQSSIPSLPSTSLATIPFIPNAGSSGPAPLSTIATSTAAAAVAIPAPLSTVATSTPGAPQTSPATSAGSSNGDPCGPTIQDNPNYPNTCAAKVDLTATPATYGVYCGADGPTTSINWDACAAVYSGPRGVCGLVLQTIYPKGAWVWSDPSSGCAIGVWMPRGTDGTGTGAAMTPSAARCEDLIFKAMADSCRATSNVASVNLAAPPSFSDPTQTGSQVNAGYPSFVIAGKSPQGLTELPVGLGWSTARLVAGGPAGPNANDQDGLTEMRIHNPAGSPEGRVVQPADNPQPGGTINF